MVGRKVAWKHGNFIGTVIKWEPLSPAMTDVLVQTDDDKLCWFADYELTPTDGKGNLPSRKEECIRARADTKIQLKEIMAKFKQDFNKPWLGMEFGKAIIGNAILGAISDVDKK